MDFLKSAVASAISKDPPFPYTFGDRVEVDSSIWTLYNGTKREDGSNCSILAFDSLANKSRLPLARNGARKLRTLRHPGVIRVYDTVETETYIYIATERVTPLGWHVRRKSLSVETSKWGLYTIANTLKFINDEAASVHGNVRVSSIFTSESGEWRLGGFDVLSSMEEEDGIIYSYGSLVPDSGRYAAPEVAKGGWDSIKRNPVAAVDAYGYGILIFEVFNSTFMGGDQIGQTKNIPPSMHQSYKRLVNVNPKARLSTSQFLEQGKRNGGFFQTPLVQLSEAIESLGLKSDVEREELINKLDEVSNDFPEEFFKMKVLPELLKSVEFGGGGPKVFSAVMKIGSKLSEDDYASRITPVVVRLFASPDRAIRVCLLDNLPQMIDHLSQKIVNDKIFPQLVTGFTDVAPVVREQTVKAVLTIITKLSDRTINGDLLKYLAKTANDEQPGIRTNTTICLGRIARSLGANTRQKVLTAAFTRSLRDPFVHARNAALMALAVTSDLFTEEDCANKLLPFVCPSLVDKEKLVRDQAQKTFDVYTQRVRKYANTLPDTVLPPANAGAVNGAVPRMGTPQNDTSWAGWAISSFTNKLASASGEIQSKPYGNPAAPANFKSSSVPPTVDAAKPALPSTASASTLHRQTLHAPSAPVLTRTTTDQFFNSVQDEDDELDAAWGDIDGDSFFDAPSEIEASAPAPTFDDGGEPDFAGWLSAQAQAKSKPPLPKGLARHSPTALGNNRQANAARSTTTGSVGSGLGPRKLATAAPKPKSTSPKKIDIKPKEGAGDDDWGDAWD
ncbi:MAG: SCY1 kinase [Lasallia pustulata]|uniref:SCY1 kinase n=1 Tax=Lasallia pustulata TaxID=136370 RepID=A0A5M8PNE6_9LECA|nr:MAG: SCY1 kinase [Lasallia pustulata]